MGRADAQASRLVAVELMAVLRWWAIANLVRKYFSIFAYRKSNEGMIVAFYSDFQCHCYTGDLTRIIPN